MKGDDVDWVATFQLAGQLFKVEKVLDENGSARFVEDRWYSFVRVFYGGMILAREEFGGIGVRREVLLDAGLLEDEVDRKLGIHEQTCTSCLETRNAHASVSAARPTARSLEYAEHLCPLCSQRHLIGQFSPGQRLVPLFSDDPLIERGDVVVVREWSQYGGPLYYRVQLEVDQDVRANFYACQLSTAVRDSISGPTAFHADGCGSFLVAGVHGGWWCPRCHVVPNMQSIGYRTP